MFKYLNHINRYEDNPKINKYFKETVKYEPHFATVCVVALIFHFTTIS